MALEIQKNSRQIPSKPKYTADKKYCDLLYSILQEMSYLEGTERYVDKKDIKFTELGEKLNLSRQTTSAKFKNLMNSSGGLGLIEEDKENKRYHINTLPNEVATLVPFSTLRVMNNALNLNAISLYVYFLNLYYARGQRETIVTMFNMKSFIGIATSTTSNDDIIHDIMKVLKKLGLINYETRQESKEKSYIYLTDVQNIIKD